MDSQALQVFVVSLSSRNLSKLDLCRLIGQSDNRTWSHKRLFPKAESKINALAANTCMVLARVPLYTLHCALYTVPTPPPPLHFCFFSAPYVLPVLLLPCFILRASTSLSWPECGHNLPESGARTNWLLLLARHAPSSSAPRPLSHMRRRSECSLSLRRRIAAAIYGPYRGRQQRKRLIKFNNFVKC